MVALLAMTRGAASLLWVLAAILVIVGVVALIGPGGVSIFK
jgi:hypothetical protein